jgi:hypothetical protein
MIRTVIIFLSLLCVTINGYSIRSAVDVCSGDKMSAAIKAQPFARCCSVFSSLPVLIVTEWLGFFKEQSARGNSNQGNGKTDKRQGADFILSGFENVRLERAEHLIESLCSAAYASSEILTGWILTKKFPPGSLDTGIHSLLRWWCLFIILCARRGFGDYIYIINYNNKSSPVR